MTRESHVIGAWLVVLAVIAVACTSTVPQPTPSPLPSATLEPTNSQAVPTTTPAATPSVPPTPPPKVVGDLALEQCDPAGVLPCDHQAVVITEPIAASGVALTYSTEWADGRTDRPNWKADALGLGWLGARRPAGDWIIEVYSDELATGAYSFSIDPSQ